MTGTCSERNGEERRKLGWCRDKQEEEVGDISVASEVAQRTSEDWGPKPSQAPIGSQTKFPS